MPKPEWLKVRAPGLGELPPPQGADARPGPPHRLRRGELPQHRRVLAPRHRDVHDPRQHLHALVRLLQRHARHAARRPTSRSRSRSRARSTRWSSATSSSRRSIAMTCRTSARRTSRATIARDARANPALPARGPDPRFPGRRGRAAHRPRRPARRAQPQHRDGAAPLPDRAAGRTLRARARVLGRSREIAPDIATKSGLMVGLGEEWDEVVATLQDLRARRRQHRHDRPVPAPVTGEPADGALLHAVRVRRAQTARPRDGLRARRIRARSSAARITRTSRRPRTRLRGSSAGAALTSLRQGYGGPPKRFARRRKVCATHPSRERALPASTPARP